MKRKAVTRRLLTLLLTLILMVSMFPMNAFADFDEYGECIFCNEWHTICDECGACRNCSIMEGTHCAVCEECLLQVDACLESLDAGMPACIDCCTENGWHCPECNEHIANDDCWCEDGMHCLYCVDNYGGFYCAECSVLICPLCDNVEYCPECETCIDCLRDLNSAGVSFCEDCNACINCLGGDGHFCPSCCLCEECSTLCQNCQEYCSNCSTLCTSCEEYCSECSYLCSDCNACENCVDICESCNEHCLECYNFCTECNQCEDCVYVLCDSCGEICSDCAEAFCEACGQCSDCCGPVCVDCSQCENCSSATICEECQEHCDDCVTFCANCGKCAYCCTDSDTCPHCGRQEPSVTICSICGNFCTDCHMFCENCGEVCTQCSNTCFGCGKCHYCTTADWCWGCGDWCFDCIDQCPGCGLCEDCCNGELHCNSYTMIFGNEQTVAKGNTAKFISDADFDDFSDVWVDGGHLSSWFYNVVSGSTVVTLHAAYINSLSDGTHSIRIVSADGSADGTFTVVTTTSVDESPNNYAIRITNGYARRQDNSMHIGNAKKNELVLIVADSAPAGQVFDKWIVTEGNVTLADETAKETIFTMPANTVKIEATYKSDYAICPHCGEQEPSVTICNVCGNFCTDCHTFCESCDEVCTQCSNTCSGCDKCHYCTTADWCWGCGDWCFDCIDQCPGCGLCMYCCNDDLNCISYSMIYGNGQTVVKGNTAKFVSDADFDDFSDVWVDAERLSTWLYSVEPGSTAVTLHAAYINTLSDGTHSIRIVSSDGAADGTFSVITTTPAAENPSNYSINITDGYARRQDDSTHISTAKENELILIVANSAPEGQVFDKWIVTEGNVTLADETAKETIFTMPANTVKIKATYKTPGSSSNTCPHCGEQEPSVTICSICGNFCTDCHMFCENCGEVCSQCSNFCSGCGKCHYCTTADWCWGCGDWCFDCIDHCTGCGLCVDCCVGEMHCNSYNMLSGNGQYITKGNTARFVSEAEFNKFSSVWVDAERLSSWYYNVVPGSTAVTLHAAFINTLNYGKHTIRIESTDGIAEAAFTVISPVAMVASSSSYRIAVTNGRARRESSSIAIGNAKANELIIIMASAAPEGQVFDKWIVKEGGITLADETVETTIFTMPARRVEIEATYKPIPTDEGNGNGNSNNNGGNSSGGAENLNANALDSNQGSQTKGVLDPNVPKTGNASPLFLWFALLFVSGIGVVATITIRKKEK